MRERVPGNGDRRQLHPHKTFSPVPQIPTFPSSDPTGVNGKPQAFSNPRDQQVTVEAFVHLGQNGVFADNDCCRPASGVGYQVDAERKGRGLMNAIS